MFPIKRQLSKHFPSNTCNVVQRVDRHYDPHQRLITGQNARQANPPCQGIPVEINGTRTFPTLRLVADSLQIITDSLQGDGINRLYRGKRI